VGPLPAAGPAPQGDGGGHVDRGGGHHGGGCGGHGGGGYGGGGRGDSSHVLV